MVSIEARIIEYLYSVLDVPVSGSVPTGEVTFVTVEKTSSRAVDHVTIATLAIQSWSDTQANAMILNERVKDAMIGAGDLDDVYYSKCQTDYNYPDLSQKHWRYQAVFNLAYITR